MSQHPKPDQQPAHIVLGVSAGIAAYKAVFLLRILQRDGYRVRVVPTPSSLEFVGRATWEGLTLESVNTDVFHGGGADHVELARGCAAIVIAPATADVIARIANGVVIAPAMHTQMWRAAATQENIARLLKRGYIIVGPEDGDLASGDHGAGRMSEPEVIAAHVRKAYVVSGDLVGKRILITAGGTREAIDPVRFLGNRSSGRQGIAIAREALSRGAEVDAALIPQGCSVIDAPSAQDVYDAVMSHLGYSDALVMAAAIADYRPRAASASKIKKEENESAPPRIELTETTDVLRSVSSAPDRPRVVLGFAAETGDQNTVLSYGAAKAKRKGADYLAVNAVGTDIGFGDVPNYVYVLNQEGSVVTQGGGTKADVARILIDLISQRFDTMEA